jgi:hypothetical protein
MFPTFSLVYLVLSPAEPSDAGNGFQTKKLARIKSYRKGQCLGLAFACINLILEISSLKAQPVVGIQLSS